MRGFPLIFFMQRRPCAKTAANLPFAGRAFAARHPYALLKSRRFPGTKARSSTSCTFFQPPKSFHSA